MPAIVLVHLRAETAQVLRRSLPAGGPWRLVRSRPQQLAESVTRQLTDAVVVGSLDLLEGLQVFRSAFPHIPVVGFTPCRPDDGPLLAACQSAGMAGLLVEGVDNAVAGDLVVRWSAAGDRRRTLADAIRILRLGDPLQREVWNRLLDRTDQAIRTSALARQLAVSREHLSRQFGAGGAPNLKRVIDLTRVATAASLLANPGFDVARVAKLLGFATTSHLSATSRRIAGVAGSGLADLGARGVLGAFARGNTRSRL